MPKRDSAGSNVKVVALVCGARPNFVKIAPLYRALIDFGGAFRPVIIHTGQHYDRLLSDVFFEELNIPRPDVSLGVGSGTHAEQTASVMIGIERYLQDQRPDLLVCVGDVNSTLAAAVAAAKCRVPCAHIEAGLRSHDRAMPEEINRIVADHTSDWLYTTCREAGDNLRREGIDPDRIVFAGNVMIDTLLATMDQISASDITTRLGLRPGTYLLATMHRPVNVDAPVQMAKLLETIRRLADSHRIVFPVHPRTRARLEEFAGVDVWMRTIGAGNVLFCEPLGYIDFLALQKSALAVLTDSGGVQEETTVLGVPCLTLRDHTERPVTITHGTNQLTGLDPDRVVALMERIARSERPKKRIPEYWDGRASRRIAAHLAAVVFAGDDRRTRAWQSPRNSISAEAAVQNSSASLA